MKVSLIEFCHCCGQPTGGELIEEKFQKWAWRQGSEFKVRLVMKPEGEDEIRRIFELTITMDDRDEVTQTLAEFLNRGPQ